MKLVEWLAGGLRILIVLVVAAGIFEFGDGWNPLALPILAVAMTIVVTLGHELGHAAAVWFQRGVVLVICVWGLTYRRGRRRLAFENVAVGGDMVGVVHFLPPEEDWTRFQHGVVAAAGPLADVALGLAALLIVSASPLLAPPASPVPVVVAADDASPPDLSRPALPSDAEVKVMMAEWRARDRQLALSDGIGDAGSILALLAFASAIFNLLPYRGSDGAQILDLWRGRNRFARTPKRR